MMASCFNMAKVMKWLSDSVRGYYQCAKETDSSHILRCAIMLEEMVELCEVISMNQDGFNNPHERAAFLAEWADVLFTMHGSAICFDFTPEELETAFRIICERNMEKEIREGDAKRVKSPPNVQTAQERVREELYS